MQTTAHFVDLLRRRLDALPPSASEWAHQRFQGLDDGVVLYGAGRFGTRAIKLLRDQGIPVHAIADANPSRWHTRWEGLHILSPQAAADAFGHAHPFLVSALNTEHCFRRTAEELRLRGVKQVLPPMALMARFPETFLPYYGFDVPHGMRTHLDAIEAAHGLWADVFSRSLFEALLSWRIDQDETCPGPVSGAQYFPPDLLPPRPSRHFVDLGAYDGDTLESFLDWTGGHFEAYTAVEPDPENWQGFQKRAATLQGETRERIRFCPCAVLDKVGPVRFSATGTAAASLGGNREIQGTTLDQLDLYPAPDFIKMDIEGAEPLALEGGRNTILRAEPCLAVSVYHLPDHLWTLPLAIHQMLPNARLHLRPHGWDGWDWVCYAISSRS